MKKLERKSRIKSILENERIGAVCCVFQLVVTLIFAVEITELNMLPINYMAIIGGVLTFVTIILLVVILRAKRGSSVGKIVSLLLSISLIISSCYIYNVNSTLTQISSVSIKMENMVVAVLATDSAESITDAVDYSFAVQGTSETEEIEEHAEQIVEEIETQIENELTIIIYDTLLEQIEALENGEVDAIIYNEAYISIVEDENPDFSESIKVIYEYGIEIEIEQEEEIVEEAEIETNAIAIYISGIDVYGSITQTSRSDVNIIAIVNPDTEQILLVSTPRDYYVTFPNVTGDSKDKLTHAAIYGVDVSMDTLEEIYDMNINYYARVNFTSFTEMIDALGGVEVYSSQSFQTTVHNGVSTYVSEGMNYFNGTQALLFARERYNLDGGDFQRGENQEELVKAMIEKITSPAIITGAYDIIESVADNVDTNMPTSMIQELVKTQIDEGTEWEIIMMSAEGTTGSAVCYSYAGDSLSVVYPDEESVAEISEAIDTIIAGEIIETE